MPVATCFNLVEAFERIDVFSCKVKASSKLDPEAKLYSLQYQQKATPPDFRLVLLIDPHLWFDAVSLTLIGELKGDASQTKSAPTSLPSAHP